MAAPKSKRYNAPALDKGLDILEFIASQRSPRSQAEIAAGLGRGVNEICRMLVGLAAEHRTAAERFATSKNCKETGTSQPNCLRISDSLFLGGVNLPQPKDGVDHE